MRNFYLLLLMCVFVLAGCGSGDDDHGHSHDGHSHSHDGHSHEGDDHKHDHGEAGHTHTENDDHDHSTEANADSKKSVEITEVVKKNLGITFVKAEKRDIRNVIQVPGAYELTPRAKQEYHMVISGYIRYAVDQFDQVKAGDLLFKYRSPDWVELQHEIIVAQQKIASARAGIEVGKAVIEETSTKVQLLKARLASLEQANVNNAALKTQAEELVSTLKKNQAQLEAKETEYQNAESAFEHAIHRASTTVGLTEAELIENVTVEGNQLPRYRTIDWIEVKAERDGVVESMTVSDGGFAEPGGLVMNVVDINMVRFRAVGLQRDLAIYQRAERAKHVMPDYLKAGQRQSVVGNLTIGVHAHPQERTITLYSKPEKVMPWMQPGVSGFIEVTKEGSANPVLAIPTSAVIKDGLQHVYFVRKAGKPNMVQRVEAELGLKGGGYVEIHNQELKPGDEVVLNGVYELKLATQSSGDTQKGGHFHADGTFHESDH